MKTFFVLYSLSPLVINQLHNNLKRAMRLGSSQEWGGGHQIETRGKRGGEGARKSTVGVKTGLLLSYQAEKNYYTIGEEERTMLEI